MPNCVWYGAGGKAAYFIYFTLVDLQLLINNLLIGTTGDRSILYLGSEHGHSLAKRTRRSLLPSHW